MSAESLNSVRLDSIAKDLLELTGRVHQNEGYSKVRFDDISEKIDSFSKEIQELKMSFDKAQDKNRKSSMSVYELRVSDLSKRINNQFDLVLTLADQYKKCASSIEFLYDMAENSKIDARKLNRLQFKLNALSKKLNNQKVLISGFTSDLSKIDVSFSESEKRPSQNEAQAPLTQGIPKGSILNMKGKIVSLGLLESPEDKK